MSRFLWLEGIFDEETVHRYPAISAASNFWQKGCVTALRNAGHLIDVIGFTVERVWPFGHLFISSKQARILEGFRGEIIGYVNLPRIRGFFQYVFMLRAVRRHLEATQNTPDYQVVFSCLEKSSDETAAIRVAKYVKRHYGIPWLCIIADGAVPSGADSYIFMPWLHYQASCSSMRAIHIDGGVPVVDLPSSSLESAKPIAPNTKSLMYMGSLTKHGGALELAQAFKLVQGDQLELWICGRGDNPELDAIAATDQRIKMKGFLSEADLNALASRAFAFANPRPSSFAPNRLNYPSKLLHYLAFGKPVISTFTDGVSPDYEKALVPIEDESIQSLAKAIRVVLSMGEPEYSRMTSCVQEFREAHSWPRQVQRLMSWLEEDMPSK